MSGALSLKKDIEVLVDKYKDVALPEDLLSRLAEDARLMAVKENIRSMHEDDPFGLFVDGSDPSDDANGDDENDRKRKVKHAGQSEKKPLSGSEEPQALPEFMKRLLSSMTIKRHDKVAALNGFTTIDAEVEFIPPSHVAEGTTTDKSATGNKGEAKSKKAKKAQKAKEKADAQCGGSSAAKSSEAQQQKELKPVHLQFSFRREPIGSGDMARLFSGMQGDIDMDDDDSCAKRCDAAGVKCCKIVGKEGVEIEYLGDDIDDGREETKMDDDPSEGGKKRSMSLKNGKPSKDPGEKTKKHGSKAKSGVKQDEEPSKKATTNVKSKDKAGHKVPNASPQPPQQQGQKKKRNLPVKENGEGNARESDARRKRSKADVATLPTADDSRAARKQVAKSEDKDDGDKEDCDEQEIKALGNGIFSSKVLLSHSESDGSDDDSSMAFEPRTVVTYTISGGIDFERPEVLLEAVVYAREDGPGCILRRNGPKAGGKDSEDNDDDEEDDDNDNDNGDGDDSSDDIDGQEGDVDEDTSDANVDGDALSRIGRALGIHEPSEDSDSEDEDDSADSASGARGDVRKKQEDGDAAGQKLSLEDMIWWLMMFPFFEKEFDMVGVVGAGLFAEEDSDVDSDDVPDGFSGDLMLIDGNDDDEDEIEDASSDAGRKKRKGVSIEEL